MLMILCTNTQLNSGGSRYVTLIGYIYPDSKPSVLVIIGYSYPDSKPSVLVIIGYIYPDSKPSVLVITPYWCVHCREVEISNSL
jgi:hypothetical protein